MSTEQQPWTLPSRPATQAQTAARRFWDTYADTSTAGHTEAQARRARVLAHPDLAAALCQMVGGYTRPENWNGYVPPRFDVDGRINDSPRRADLVEICREALRREQERVAA